MTTPPVRRDKAGEVEEIRLEPEPRPVRGFVMTTVGEDCFNIILG